MRAVCWHHEAQSWVVKAASLDDSPLDPLPKPGRGAPGLQRELLDIARREEDALARALLAALRAGVKSWSLSELADLIERAPGTVADALDPDRPGHGVFPAVVAKAEEDELRDVLARIIAAGGESALPMLQGRFDIINPRAVAAAQQRAGALIRSISAAQRQLVRDLIAQTVGGQVIQGIWPATPQQVARHIRDVVGLHPRQAQAVASFRAALQQAADGRGAAAARAFSLRDGRLAIREGMTAGQIDAAVARYAERQLAYRATMISRTETVWSANKGLIEGWGAASEAGLIGPDAWVEWVVNPDDALCELCESLAGASEELSISVGPDGLSGAFVAELEDGSTVEGEAPPLHPSCRCTLVVHVSESSEPVNPRTVVTER